MVQFTARDRAREIQLRNDRERAENRANVFKSQAFRRKLRENAQKKSVGLRILQGASKFGLGALNSSAATALAKNTKLKAGR